MKQLVRRPGFVALVAVAVTYLFWIEYLPPFRRMHVTMDLEGFHWPLLAAAFEAIRHGRLPLWDPSIYCGIPFAGNIQAALFYPPSWLLFAVNLRSRHLLFETLQAWVFLHAAAAFFLCYLWLRGRKLLPLGSALGAAAFAFGGYMVSQNNHAGVVTGYAWTPLAWLGIDEAVETRSWRPLWKTAAASALCFLAGYPLSFVAFAIATSIYGAARSWRYGTPAILAIAASLALGAVQLLPALEASALKTFDPKYGPGFRDPLFFIHFAVPDWVGFRAGDPYQYLYLGIPVLFGLPLFLRRPDRAVMAVMAVCAWLVTDPFYALSAVTGNFPFLAQVLSNFNAIEPATLAFAFVAACGIDRFAQRGSAIAGGRWLPAALAAALAGWCVYRLAVWPRPVTGWRSLAETCIGLALFAMGMFLCRRGRIWLALLLCAMVLVDYKVCGTSRTFSGIPGNLDQVYRRGFFPGMEPVAFDALRRNRHYRLALDGMQPTELRRYGLATPQGADPLLPERYKAALEESISFRTNRLFDLDPANEALLRRLGVGFYLTRDGAPRERELASHPLYRLIGTGRSFVRVYEYRNALPPWRWEGTGSVACVRWEPEMREFQLNAAAPGRFVLVEQFHPGWRCRIDGRETAIELADGAFQSVAAPGGAHTIRFEYSPLSVRTGAAVSAISAIAFAAWIWTGRRKRAARLTRQPG